MATIEAVTLLVAGRMATAHRVIPSVWLRVEGGTVAAMGTGSSPGRPDVDAGDGVIVPGFVDLHCHGGGGCSYGSADAQEAADAAAFHLAHGTTCGVASLVSDAGGVLLTQIRILADLTAAGVVAGIHLEGPYLAEARCGAHDPAVLRDPDPGEIGRLLVAARSAMRMLTLAPERPGALAAIRQLAAAEVVVAVGHTDASYEQVGAAISAGARVATHLGNAMAPMIARHPGPVAALLGDARVHCELIADGHHLHDGFIRHALRLAGPDRVALITDAVAAAGHHEGVVRTVGTAALAGTTLTMDRVLRRAVQAHGLSLPDAVAMTSKTPAAVLGRGDIGVLRVGGRADLVLLDEHLVVGAVLHGGKWVRGSAPGASAPGASAPGAVRAGGRRGPARSR